MRVIDLVIYADFLCAWCFLMKRSLETALYRYKIRHPDIEFRLIWKPYLLYPTVPKGEKRAIYTSAAVTTEKLLTFTRGIQAAGTRHGIDFDVKGQTGPSQRSHRLVALTLRALGPAAQTSVVESLFRGHFENGEDLTNEDWLMSVGRSVGLDEIDVLRALRSDEMASILDEEFQAAIAGGIKSVPNVVIGGRYGVAGYQQPALFEGAFDKYMRDALQREDMGPIVVATPSPAEIPGAPVLMGPPAVVPTARPVAMPTPAIAPRPPTAPLVSPSASPYAAPASPYTAAPTSPYAPPPASPYVTSLAAPLAATTIPPSSPRPSPFAEPATASSRASTSSTPSSTAVPISSLLATPPVVSRATQTFITLVPARQEESSWPISDEEQGQDGHTSKKRKTGE